MGEDTDRLIVSQALKIHDLEKSIAAATYAITKLNDESAYQQTWLDNIAIALGHHGFYDKHPRQFGALIAKHLRSI